MPDHDDVVPDHFDHDLKHPRCGHVRPGRLPPMAHQVGDLVSTFRKKPVIVEAHRWWRNGDHPYDSLRTPPDWEGEVVRYFRSPNHLGTEVHDTCGCTWHVHGWIDTLEGGHIVCPGDWIITGVQGERYPIKDPIFCETYEAADENFVSPATVSMAEQVAGENWTLRSILTDLIGHLRDMFGDGTTILGESWDKHDVASTVSELTGYIDDAEARLREAAQLREAHNAGRPIVIAPGWDVLPNAAGLVARLRELHYPDGAECVTCPYPWPCQTAQALDVFAPLTGPGDA